MADISKLTAEQIEAEKKAAVEAATKNLQDEISKKNEELSKLQNKDANFAKLREQTEAAEKRAEEAQKAAESVKKTMFDSQKNRLVDALVGENEELRKKLDEDIAARTAASGIPIESAQIEKMIKDAYISISGNPYPANPLRQFVSSQGGRPVTANTPAGTVDPKVKEAAAAFNAHIPDSKRQISEEDLKNPKYAVKPGQSADSNYQL